MNPSNGSQAAYTSRKRSRTDGDGEWFASSKRPRTVGEHERLGSSMCDAPCVRNKHHSSRLPHRLSRPEEKPSAVVLSAKLPAVLAWARKFLDNHLNGTHSILADWEAGTVKDARDQKRKVLDELVVPRNVLLDLDRERKFWSGESRFWTNVFAFAIRLPPAKNLHNILDAMNRYPSSVLVHTGVQTIFGFVRKHRKERVRVSLPRPNAFSVFDGFAANGHPTSKWFERNSYGRVQEIAIHITSVVEYVLCCATRAREASKCAKEAHAAFLKSLVEDIQLSQVRNSLEVILLSPFVVAETMDVDLASQCLQRAIEVANSAVLKGLAKAGRRYGLKRMKCTTRKRVQLWMMRRLFPEVMDMTMIELKNAISQTLGPADKEEGLGSDLVELQLTRLLRAMEKLFINIGDSYFGEQFKISSATILSNDVQRLLSSKPYKFTESR
ncbi:hypothetical protein BWQ96_10452 [Gracilariopsis chorda]|uniref:Uncharacterized protein n=1 Tax=Gracilariopsis chorda TaxID=448386 RepID=A0A2V3ICL9_9FLOR|nr:hypothetical protein BWQ96_10452 [Gracilariopsis chorda]|eukprot:PXF39842.1 hypothetical protein BWQ96_10452 [Gracilariopsis chorda]